MIKMTATQFSKLWNELPNPNSSAYLSHKDRFPEYRMLFMPENERFFNTVKLEGNQSVSLVQPKEIKFRLNYAMNGNFWEVLTPITLVPISHL